MQGIFRGRRRCYDGTAREFIRTRPRAETQDADPQQMSWHLRLKELNLKNAEFWHNRKEQS
jgi:hypothetical protein